MPSFREDQAAGLRRIMTTHKPKIVTLISATAAENQPQLLTNLASTISLNNCDVLVVHAAQDTRSALRHYGIDTLPTLYDVVHQKSALAQSIKTSKHGFSLVKVFPRNQKTITLENTSNKRLNILFDNLAGLYEVVLVDARLNKNHQLPLDTLNDGEILIQLGRDTESIKQAYLLVKQIYGQVGRRSFGIIVEGASDVQAAAVFRNISQVAKDFLHVELEFFGAIPADDRLARAAKLGRTVIDAFPSTPASKAFKTLAQRLNYKQNQSAKVKVASFT